MINNWVRNYGFGSLALAIAYCVVGWLGTQLAIPPGYATAVFPASGIALGVLLLRGANFWPGIFLGSFCLNFLISAQQLPDFSVIGFFPVALTIASGAMFEALIALWFIHHWIGSDNPLRSVKNVLGFLFFAAALSSTVSASIGVSTLSLSGISPWASFEGNWLTWWLGDVMGILVITPLILNLVKPLDILTRPFRPVETILLVSCLIGVTGLVFLEPLNSEHLPLVFLTLPPMVWAGFRFGQCGATFAVLIVSGISLSATIQGQGPFVGDDTYQSLLLLQTFIGMAWATSHMVAAAIYERNQAEELYRASEERLSLALDATTQGIWDWNMITDEVFFSHRWTNSLGYNPGDIEPHVDSWKKLIHPDDMSKVMEKLNAHIEGRTSTYECENRLKTKSGKWRWNRDRGKIITRDKDGKPVRMVGMDEDLTERKEMEWLLKENEEIFSGIVNNASTAIYLKDLQGRYILVNRHFEEVLHLTQEYVKGKTDFDLFPDEIAEKFKINDAKVLESGKVLEFEETAPHEEGLHTYISIKFPVSKANGEVMGVAGISTDITARKRAESILAVQNKALGKLARGFALTEFMDTLTQGYEETFVGARCSILLLNEESQTLHSCSAPSLPKKYSDFVDGTKVGPSVGSCGTAAYKGEIIIVENIATSPLWAAAKDVALSYGLASCWSCPISGSGDKVLGTFAVYYDSPKRPGTEELDKIQSIAYLASVAIENKENEEKLREAHLALEGRVKERTAELNTSNKLLQSEMNERQEQNRILETLAKGGELTTVLDAVALMAEAHCEGMTCSILTLNPETRKMHYVSGPNVPKGYVEELDGFIIGPEVGSCGTAAYCNKAVIVEDINTDPLWKDYKHIALRHGVQACWSTPIQDSHGEVLGTFAFFWSTPKKSEDETLKFHQSIAHLVGIAIEQKQSEAKIRFAMEKSEKASRAKSEFLSRMSHELRTPMNAIMGFTQLMGMDAEHPLADFQKENLKRVTSAGNHLLELINEVLELAQIESGKLKLAKKVVDLQPILNEVIAIFKPLADEREISLCCSEIPEGYGFVEVDPLKIKQVFLNLISNAIKYNRRGGSVYISSAIQKNQKLRISVKDTGLGIADENMSKLFVPFERFDLNVEKIEGAGIGLSISKQLIEMMGGQLGVESTVNVGSCFNIDFPVFKGMISSVDTDKGSSIPPLSETQNGNKKILYVEDIQANLDLVTQILYCRPEIELLSAANAHDGIEIAMNQSPDLILMDIHLPGMDGLSALKELKNHNKTRGIPVIALSADTMNNDIQNALEFGFESYLTKPLDVHKFLHEVDRFLE